MLGIPGIPQRRRRRQIAQDGAGNRRRRPPSQVGPGRGVGVHGGVHGTTPRGRRQMTTLGTTGETIKMGFFSSPFLLLC